MIPKANTAPNAYSGLYCLSKTAIPEDTTASPATVNISFIIQTPILPYQKDC